MSWLKWLKLMVTKIFENMVNLPLNDPNEFLSRPLQLHNVLPLGIITMISIKNLINTGQIRIELTRRPGA